jgi:hypothetical protein
MTALDIAFRLQENNKACSPYRTGNLRNNGIGAVSALTENQAEYRINEFDAAPYGIMLNEAVIIRTYTNKHYRWHDNSIDTTVSMLQSQMEVGE